MIYRALLLISLVVYFAVCVAPTKSALINTAAEKGILEQHEGTEAEHVKGDDDKDEADEEEAVLHELGFDNIDLDDDDDDDDDDESVYINDNDKQEEDHSNDRNGEEDNDFIQRRRKRGIAREILLSRDHHPMQVTLVMLDDEIHHRVKRTSFIIPNKTWPNHKIPYVFDAGYKKENIPQLKQVISLLENQVCVQFTNEQNFDPNNPNWFKEHGYTTNSYIRFVTKSSCFSNYGRGSGKPNDRARKVSPCNQLTSMIHEVLHTLGAIHAQSYPLRERYITIHKDNIIPDSKNNFQQFSPDDSDIEYQKFDPSSVMMYFRMSFTVNGLATSDFLRPEMGHLSGFGTYNNILRELTKNYKCQEKFCKGENPDCGVGYLGYVNQHCTCVCPPGLDPSVRCKAVINSMKTSSWPETPFSLYKAQECPAGAEEGLLPLTIKRNPIMTMKKLSSSGHTLNIQMCTKTKGNSSFESWPMGSYCIGKVKDVPCSAPFKEGEFSVTTEGTMRPTGSIGDVTIDGQKVTMKKCCQNQGDVHFPMKLPTDKPFRLMCHSTDCQEVDGMWALKGRIILATKASKTGSTPSMQIQRNGVLFYSCYYQPPKYGCSQMFKMDSKKSTATVTVPVVSGSRESNRRCFYYFQAPEKSRLRLTINKMQLHPSDRFLVKRFNLEENPFKIDPTLPTYQMVTENNTLMIEYWSFFQSDSSYTGATFTVDLLLPEGLCYNAETQGADYAGNKEISETYEECVPWKDATSCPDFPWTGTNGLHLLNSGKSCRNLDTTGMLQPWCYTFVNGTTCKRRYCDVCNEVAPADRLGNCPTYISSTPNFCRDALGRYGCFKSCGMDTAPYNKREVKCSKPVLPLELIYRGELQESYDIGTKVTIYCNGIYSKIECTTHGWTPLNKKCMVKRCIDASQLCQNALSKFPSFCTHAKSKTAAETYCKKSCGLCAAQPCVDTSSPCQSIVSRFPAFCTKANYQKAARRYCKKSCGFCDKNSCSVSSHIAYSLVSPANGTMNVGQDAIFQCKDGLHHVSGNLQRICSFSGNLLGQEPVCEVKPPPKDINLEQIGEKNRKALSRSLFVMLGFGLDVPFDGTITRWYYYCRNTEDIILLVYRKTRDANKFELVGSNKATCVANWPWSYDVPVNKRVAVRKGDVLGVYDGHSSVMVFFCGGAQKNWAPVATTRVRDVQSVLGNKVTKFNKQDCTYLAIGARVEPS